ncbi:pyrroline-5-carboxylate reductase 1, mitochondrial [Strongylocentrotus purpuratus]|uniref:Pyrroline-5-carboxylate reductase n=1 Tax=Strongylocentrotus purpuratus TaxID=7668 RepID=A0A7M7RFI2_STRPU|nr:pyrroline-5-carboxylate reductase 1, mitochondrial [Strongylocentrotus purpuratus]|eukprot:XP_788839.1 PREDICTED: pyrroline-5-carboxylate reductase 1, mitochondrial [Strongylocentrotus purpuratus]
MSIGTIGFVGAGNVALTLIKGLLSASAVGAERIMASAPSNRNLQVIGDLGAKTTSSNREILETADTIFLAIKPNLAGAVIKEIAPFVKRDQLFISLAAGISLDFIENNLPERSRVVRAMPNTPTIIREGATVFACGSHIKEGDNRLIQSLFSKLGICIEGDESIIDAAMAVSGCGPAYAYVAIDALADGGVKMGLPRDIAIKLAAQTLLGSAKMVLRGGKHPSQLKDDVCSPGGTTIDAIHELERGGFRKCLIEAVEAACNKARRLNDAMLYSNKK